MTITLWTHFIDRSSEESFIHPSGLPVILEGARLFDCEQSASGELRLEFEPMNKKPSDGAIAWTVIIPSLHDDDNVDEGSATTAEEE